MNDREDEELLSAGLRELAVKPSSDPAWSRLPALRVIDCILSLNRPYDSFVVPRLNRFEREHPSVRAISDLHKMIASSLSPHQFVLINLNYDHEERADTLNAVVKWLVTISGRGSEQGQLSNLERWAGNSQPQDHSRLAIRGFGLAGFQYLRMLFGANTTKPDRYICQFVESHIGRKVKDLEAVQLLQRAAQLAGINLRDLDTTIWEASARKGQCTDPC